MRFYIIKASHYYWFELKDKYGKILARGVERNTYAECIADIASVKKIAPNAEIISI